LGGSPYTQLLSSLLDAVHIDEEQICNEARNVIALHPQFRSMILQIAMTMDEIKKAWETNRNMAANMGTWMHFTFEAWINRAPIAETGTEFELFKNFVLNHTNGLTAFRTEWTIFGNDEWLAGSIDFVAEDLDKSLVLYDWKRSKNLRGKYSNHFRQMKHPLGQYPDCHPVSVYPFGF
jgi:hypothetical protein